MRWQSVDRPTTSRTQLFNSRSANPGTDIGDNNAAKAPTRYDQGGIQVDRATAMKLGLGVLNGLPHEVKQAMILGTLGGKLLIRPVGLLRSGQPFEFAALSRVRLTILAHHRTGFPTSRVLHPAHDS